MSDLAFIIGTTLMYAAPLIFTAMGGVISEKSGVVNIGLEGMMVIGAFVAATVAYYSGNAYLAFLCGGLAGGVFGLIHAFVSVTCMGSQTVSGVAINILAPGLALFLCRLCFDGAAMTKSVSLEAKLPKYLNGVFAEGSIPAKIFNQDISVYLALLLVFVLWWALKKTRFGLRVRALGEHPRAADTLGVSVYGYRYACVILSGCFAGMGGAVISIGVASTYMVGTISGQGFIALAAVIFGKWKPQGALMACLVFGAAQALVVFLGWPGRLPFAVSPNFLSMIPYVLTLAILMGLGKTVAPAASGLPYKK